MLKHIDQKKCSSLCINKAFCKQCVYTYIYINFLKHGKAHEAGEQLSNLRAGFSATHSLNTN